jgi:RNA polymerase sigma factor (sigma-70 family)
MHDLLPEKNSPFAGFPGSMRRSKTASFRRGLNMASEPAQLLVTHLRRLTATARADDLPDRELVRRFAAQRDEEAFAALVRRHGPMVLRACRRVLHDPHAAEDVFQAAFLVLSRKAASLRHAESVGSWLYGVAYRLALKMRGQIARRLARESRAITAKCGNDPLAELSVREAQGILGEELACLPEKYRAPLVLCYLEGQTRDEAARRLGWAVSLVKSRLEQGRKRLRQRLKRRGLSLSAALIATLLAEETAPAAVSPVLIQTTIRTSLASPGATPAQVAALAEGAMKGMGLAKWKLGVTLVILMGALAAVAGVVAYPQPATNPEEPPSVAKVPTRPKREVKPPPRTDFYGDPLPPSAIARLGTVRLRPGHTPRLLACLPDRQSVLSVADEEQATIVSVWRLASGELLSRFEVPLSDLSGPVALSADGKTLVVLRLNRSRGSFRLLRYDLASGKIQRELAGTAERTLALAPDGETFATAGDDKSLRLWDARTGTEIRRCEGVKAQWDLLVFSPDGKVLASIGNPRQGKVQLWDTATGQALRSLDDQPVPIHSLRFSPDGKILATAASGGKTIRLSDVSTGKVLRQLACDSEIAVLAFSPDGKTLAAGGMRMEEQLLTRSAIYLWNLNTGRELRRLPGHLFGVDTLTFSSDGASLVSGGIGSALHVWDVATGKDRLPFAEHQSFVNSVAFSPDGRSLATGGLDGTIRLWEPQSGKPARLFEEGHRQRVWHVAFAPDGRTLASNGNDGSIRIWDAATGRQTRQIKQSEARSIGTFAYSPDGRTLAVSQKGIVRLLDAATGEERRRLTGIPGDYTSILFSPNGKWLVSMGLARVARSGVLQLWDAAVGKEVRKWTVAEPGQIAFCPDGRTLVMGGAGDFLPQGITERTFHVWDVVTGEDRSFTAKQLARVFGVVVSPDGRMMVWGDTAGTITLWDLAASQVRRRLQGHISFAQSLAFSPDGKTLASASADTTVLLWDVSGRSAADRTDPLSAKELQGIWDDLAGKDAAKAFDAIGLLSTAAEQAVPMLKGKLKPAPVPAERQQVARLIAELDSDQFEARRKAAEELRRLGERAEPGLRKALDSKLPLESRKRVEELLEGLRKVAASPERLRELRAVETLEHIGTPDARQVLQTLAEGAPEARLTREARAALDRLSRRRPATP